ncbi:MAG: hypothetical protein IJ760_04215 [Bacteroidales bacterium]|nr:hypothetical protein [Bacteroidales bacterium]
MKTHPGGESLQLGVWHRVEVGAVICVPFFIVWHHIVFATNGSEGLSSVEIEICAYETIWSYLYLSTGHGGQRKDGKKQEWTALDVHGAIG